MDFQKIFDMMSDRAKETRADYHLTLGKLYDKLKEIPDQESYVFFDDDESSPIEFDSYRGYYSDLALDYGNANKATVKDLLKMAEEAIDKTFYGYKGGEFTMDRNTPLWKAGYGDCGPAIMDLVESDKGYILITKDID